LKPGEFIHVLGDSHVYTNHIDPLREQVARKPDPFPILKINANDDKPLDQYTMADFELIGYHPQKTIKMDMAV
jgi:dihydrofolate reductase / thymidylate synthase